MRDITLEQGGRRILKAVGSRRLQTLTSRGLGEHAATDLIIDGLLG